jgi:hypothetical protein
MSPYRPVVQGDVVLRLTSSPVYLCLFDTFPVFLDALLYRRILITQELTILGTMLAFD